MNAEHRGKTKINASNVYQKLRYFGKKVHGIENKLKEEFIPQRMNLDMFLDIYYPQNEREEQRKRFPQIEPLVGFWRVGYEKMSRSKEPAHSEKHVDRILSSLDFLMTKFPKLFNHVNLEVLVTSIIYHDLWKSEQPLTADKGVRALIKENFIEGREASKLFTSLAREQGFDEKFIRQVSRAIYEHADFKFIKSSRESMILSDLDYFDLWSFDRLKEAIDAVKNNPNLNINKLRNRIIKNIFLFFYNKHEYYSDEVQHIARELSTKFITTLNEEIAKFRLKNP